MRYSSLRIAILILALVWAVILLVPSLSYYFRLQVRNDNEYGEPFTILAQPDYGPNFWEKVARRFPDNRDVLYLAAMEHPWSEDENDRPIEPYQIASNLPPSVVFPGRFASDTREERVRRIVILRRKFPKDVFLIAAELRAKLVSLQYERIGGELVDVTPKDKRPPGYVSPEKNGVKVNFTPADFQKVIELCRLGQKLEPENGYFDWMECYFLIHSWRDTEAFKALEAVGRKKTYDEHDLDAMRAEINALSIALGRPLLYEEKTNVLSWGQQAQHGRQRELARIISWQAVKAARRGEHPQAIRIAAALAQAGALMRDGGRSYIDGLVGIAIEAMGWGSLTHDARAALPPTMQGEEQKQKLHKILQTYLIEHGQQAMAVEAARSELLKADYIAQSQAAVNRGSFGSSYPLLFAAVSLWVGGMKLLLLLAMPLLVLVLMALGKRIGGVRRWLRWEESGADEIPPVREVWQGVLACIGLRAWVTLLCACLLIAPILVLLSGGWGAFTQQFHETPFIKILFQDNTPIWSWSLWAQIYFSLIDVVYVDTPWRTVVFCTPVLFGSLYTVWRAVEWQKRCHGEVSRWLSIGRVVDFVILSILIASCFRLAFGKDISEAGTGTVVLIIVILACASVLLTEKFLAWRKRPHRRAAVRYGLRLFQRSLFTWLVVGSVIYLLTLVATTIVRRQADATIDRVVAVGEVCAAQKP